MKRKIYLIILAFMLAVSSILFAACGKGSSSLPVVNSDEDITITQQVTVPPTEYNPKKSVYATIGRLSKFSTYKSTSTGTSVASVGLFDYVQQTDCVTIKHGDEFYSESNSSSKLVSVRHEAFAKGDNIAYRINGGEISNSSALAYKEVYGVTPDKLLSGHVFNDETIIYAKTAATGDGNYEIEIVLDKNKGNVLLFKQMKEFGGLNGYPVFTDDTVFTLTIKRDYTPVKFSYKSKYNVNVAVIGSLPCEENNEVIFSDFNEDVAIPDTEDFNAAMAMAPSEVKPSEEKPADENREKIVSALLKADLVRGVALSGIVSVNGFELPLKLGARADLDKIVNDENADVLSLADFTLSLGAYEKSFSVTYHDRKVFVNLGDRRFVKDVFTDENVSAAISALPEIIKGVDVSSMISVKKTDDLYEIRLNDLKVEVTIKTILKQLGLMGENSKAFDLSLGLYIPGDRVGVISFNLTTDVIDVRAKLNLSDEKFSLPNLDDYYAEPQILRAGADVALTLDLPDLGKFGATAQTFMSYDLTKENFAEAFKAEINVALDEEFKKLIADKSRVAGDLSPILKLAAEGDSLNLICANGKVLFVIMKNGAPVFAKNLTPGEYEFDADSLSDELTDLFDNIFVYPIADVGKTKSDDGKTVSYYVTAYNVNIGQGEEFVPGEDYETFELLRLDMKLKSAADYVFGWDADKIYVDAVAAEEVINMTEAVKTPIADIDYKQRVLEAEAAYENLTDSQKSLVYNAPDTDYYFELVRKGNALLEEVSAFAAAVAIDDAETLGEKFAKLSPDQVEFLKKYYPAEFAAYNEKISATEPNEQETVG